MCRIGAVGFQFIGFGVVEFNLDEFGICEFGFHIKLFQHMVCKKKISKQTQRVLKG